MIEKIDAVKTEDKIYLARPNKKDEGLGCIFYKGEKCSPNKVQFKLCLKCHRCRAITPENIVPVVFNKVVAMAGMLMSVFGGAHGSAGSGGAGGSGGGGGH